MFELPSLENVEEVIVDSGAAKGQTQPIIVHSKIQTTKIRAQKQQLRKFSLIKAKNLLQYL